MTYGIVSDIHAHAWSTFSGTDADGVNSRLRIILNELERAAAEVLAAGGDKLICGGDIFHVRGSVDPEVFNPTQDAIRRILDSGVSIFAIPGNHDLKSKDTQRLSSSIQALADTKSTRSIFEVFNEPTFEVIDDQPFGFAPYRPTTDLLMADLAKVKQMAGSNVGDTDVFIHAGIDGVLYGTPDHGLTDDMLGSFGFRHVFAGDYHNHKVLKHGVVSIGATTHQSWRDVGSKAGFLLVQDDGTVNWRDTHAPKFVDVTGMPDDEIKLVCDGNYIRFRGTQMTPGDIDDLRRLFEGYGALHTSIQAPKAVTAARTGSVSNKGTATLEQSISGFIDKSQEIPAHLDKKVIQKEALDVLAKSRAVYEDA